MDIHKNIQMPYSFVIDVLRLVCKLENCNMDSDIEALCKSIESQVQTKFDAIIRREIFSKYKRSKLSSEERESFRQQYLELAKIHKDWISDKETLF